MLNDEPSRFRYTSPTAIRDMLLILPELLTWVNSNWPDDWPLWEMREVEHTLCEFDKYERVRLGEGTPKQLFRSVK
ncbi:unnamed protein product [marine sediment metagenome]|uniref:Uncharacterized protein n=1 Tax=marine sediment metagenome TaxID=412755 RepID=X0SNG3_9ZZZZ